MTLTYGDALAVLDGALTFGINPSLDSIRALTDRMGRPQDALACIQVTGTNGKTSTARMIAAVLAGHGHRVGCYTSPHLESYTERMEIGGRPVGEDDFAQAIEAADDAADDAGGGSITEFELLTAAALWLFRERGCDWAVLEVGMGGRWDATTVVDPVVAVVTGVGLDHTERLGTTVAAIAADKAHIIKPASSVVLGPGTSAAVDVFLSRSNEFGLHPRFVAAEGAASPVPEECTVRFETLPRPPLPNRITRARIAGLHGEYRMGIEAPSYQVPNAATALAAAEAALGRGLDEGRVREAFGTLRLPGRFEFVADDPPVVLDGAHNPQAAAVLAGAIDEAWPDPSARPLALVGVLRDKDAPGIVEALAGHVSGFVCTEPETPRARPAGELAAVVGEATGMPCATVDLRGVDAVWVAANAPRGLVVTGSLYTVGQLRTGICP